MPGLWARAHALRRSGRTHGGRVGRSTAAILAPHGDHDIRWRLLHFHPFDEVGQGARWLVSLAARTANGVHAIGMTEDGSTRGISFENLMRHGGSTRSRPMSSAGDMSIRALARSRSALIHRLRWGL